MSNKNFYSLLLAVTIGFACAYFILDFFIAGAEHLQ